jgi:hypothetical protein
VVPPQAREETLRGIKRIMKPGAKLLMGSGSIEGPDLGGTIFIDSLFSMVREEVLKIINDDSNYNELKEIISRADPVKIDALLQAVFPAKPTRDELSAIGKKIGLGMQFKTEVHDLEREDYRFFITGIEGYVNSAILPELGIPLLQKQLRGLQGDQQKALQNKIDHLIGLRNQLITRVYDNLYDAHHGNFQVTWTQIVAKSSDEAMRSEKAVQRLVPNPEGGIDFNSKNMQLVVNGDKIDIKFDHALFDQFKRADFSGVNPVIIKISPVLNMTLYYKNQT